MNNLFCFNYTLRDEINAGNSSRSLNKKPNARIFPTNDYFCIKGLDVLGWWKSTERFSQQMSVQNVFGDKKH